MENTTSRIVVIEAVSNRYRTVLIDKDWYELGRSIDPFDIKAKNKYHVTLDGKKVVSAVPVEEQSNSTSVWDRKDWRISRLAAIERAILFLKERHVDKEDFTLEDVFEVAEKIVQFVYDDSRMETVVSSGHDSETSVPSKTDEVNKES